MTTARAQSPTVASDAPSRRRRVTPITPVSDLARRGDDPSRPGWADRATALLFGGGAAAFAVVEAARAVGAAGLPGTHQFLTATLLGAIYVLAFRTEFTSSHGATVATQPVLVAMLLTLPLGWTPLVAITAILVASASTWPRSEVRGHATLIVLASGLHVVAPVVMLQILGAQGVDGPVALAVAVLAQVVTEVAVVSVRARIGGVRWSVLAPQLVWASTIDLLLSAIGWCIVGATGGTLPGLLLVGLPVLLVGLLGRDREVHLKQALTLHHAYSEASEEARHDGLTGLSNRRAWDEALASASTLVMAGGASATILVADLDQLKVANDHYGHPEGDRLIVAFARLLQDCMPSGAMVARLGGDEFGVLVIGPQGAAAEPSLTSALRAALATAAAPGPVPLSASCGEASTHELRCCWTAFAQADQAQGADKLARRTARNLDRGVA